MKSALNMHKCEMKGENGQDPAIDACRRLYVWIGEHAFDMMGIDFHN